MTRRGLGLVILLIAGCSFNPGGGAMPDDAGVPDATDGGGVDDGLSGDDGGTCAPRCDGTSLITCTGGQPDPPRACAAGCLTAGGPHCGVLVPSNGATTADVAGVTEGVLVAAGRIVVFDTDDGSITAYTGGTPSVVRAAGAGLVGGMRFRVQAQGTGAPAAAVFGLATLTVEGPSAGLLRGSLRVIGARPALLLVAGLASVAGEIDVGAGRTGATLATECQDCGGAGGGDGATTLAAATGCAPGQNGLYDLAADETGGGGGGFGFVGAAGGASDGGATLGGGTSALTACSDGTLVPLRGGSGGGRGALDIAGGESGGGGGGALQITSLTAVALAATADLYAGGAGGVGSDANYGGGGGGSGGGFLLEAPAVTLAGGAKITANGGGGGSGRVANRGENGGRSTTRASGGAGDGVGNADGRGGLGGVGSGGAGATVGSGEVDGTGGGGGGAGIIRINTIDPFLSGAGTVVSPAHTLGAAVRQ